METKEKETKPPLFGGEQEDGELVEKPWWLKEPPRPRTPSRIVGVTSPTRLNLINECGLKYDWNYRQKRRYPSGPEALVGKFVHGVYQDAGDRRTNPGRHKPPPMKASVEELLFLLEYQAAQLANEKDLDYPITDEMYAECSAIIQARGEVDFSRTFSNEQSVSVRVPGRLNLILGGKIDRVDLVYDKRTGEVSSVLIVDYKTDHKEWSDEKLATSPQPATYLMWARREWPTAKSVVFELDMVRLGVKQRIAWSEEYQRLAISRIVSSKNLIDQGYDKPTVGAHCRFCPYRDGDSRNAACSAYQDFMERSKRQKEHKGGFEGMQVSELLREYYASNELYKLHEQRRKDLAKALAGKLGDQKSYKAGIYRGTFSAPRVDPHYPDVIGILNDVHEVTGRPIEEIAAVVCQVKHRKLKSLIEGIDDPDKRRDLGAMTENRQGARLPARSLRVSREKTKELW